MNNTTPSTDEIDLKKLFGILVDSKMYIGVITVTFTVFGLLYALLATPIYKADVLLQVESKSSGASALLSEKMDLFGDSMSSAQTEIEIIKSRMVLSQTVDELNLTTIVTPDYIPLIGKGFSRLFDTSLRAHVTQFDVSPVWQDKEVNEFTLVVLNAEKGLYALEDGAGQEILQGRLGQSNSAKGITIFVESLKAEDGNQFYLTKVSRLDAIQSLKKKLSVTEEGKNSGILSLSYTGEHRDRIEAILNSVAQNYFNQNLDRNSEEAQKSLAFLETHLPKIKKKLYASEEALNKYRQANESVDLSLNLEAQSALKGVVELESQLNDLTLKESELSHKFTKEHPMYAALLEKRAILLEERKRLDKQFQALPETQREILRLRRDVEVNQQIYVQLSNKAQELNIVKAGTVGNVRILDDAQSYTDAIKPKKSLIVVLSVLLGGMAGIGFVLIRAAMNPGITHAGEIEELGLPVYASVPFSDWEEKKSQRKKKGLIRSIEQSLLTKAAPMDLSVEALRGLRTSLHFAMMDAKNKIVMISGSAPSLGKSFISSNFAALLSESNKKVLVIDADMRRGLLHQSFGLKNEAGLSDMLSGELSIDSGIRTLVDGQLDFIPRGQTPPNPSELLMHERFSELLTWADKHYDFVLIDTPPILAVTDAAIVGAHAGTSLMVGRFEKTSAKEVDIARQRFEQSGIKINGFILNAVQKRASAYEYNYQYKYESVNA